jgi:hypothetical protein
MITKSNMMESWQTDPQDFWAIRTVIRSVYKWAYNFGEVFDDENEN